MNNIDINMLAQIRHRLEEVRLLRFGWSNPFISPFRWDAHSRGAVEFANAFTNNSGTIELTFLPPRTVSLTDINASDDDDEEATGLLGQETISASADLLADAECLEDVLDETEGHADELQDPSLITMEGDLSGELETLSLQELPDVSEVSSPLFPCLLTNNNI